MTTTSITFHDIPLSDVAAISIAVAEVLSSPVPFEENTEPTPKKKPAKKTKAPEKEEPAPEKEEEPIDPDATSEPTFQDEVDAVMSAIEAEITGKDAADSRKKFVTILSSELVPKLGEARVSELFREAGGEGAKNVGTLPPECRASVIAMGRREIEAQNA